MYYSSINIVVVDSSIARYLKYTPEYLVSLMIRLEGGQVFTKCQIYICPE